MDATQQTKYGNQQHNAAVAVLDVRGVHDSA
jgi:hypothetical protein